MHRLKSLASIGEGTAHPNALNADNRRDSQTTFIAVGSNLRHAGLATRVIEQRQIVRRLKSYAFVAIIQHPMQEREQFFLLLRVRRLLLPMIGNGVVPYAA